MNTKGKLEKFGCDNCPHFQWMPGKSAMATPWCHYKMNTNGSFCEPIKELKGCPNQTKEKTK